MQSLPRAGGWWHEMRYVRVKWGERDTFQHDFRMKRETLNMRRIYGDTHQCNAEENL
jgi:hypothetical protein